MSEQCRESKVACDCPFHAPSSSVLDEFAGVSAKFWKKPLAAQAMNVDGCVEVQISFMCQCLAPEVLEKN
jgi:hypothetical protein